MANTLQLKNDIKKLKLGLKSKGLSASIKDKLKTQLTKVENELKSAQAGAPPRKVSTTKSTKDALDSLKQLIKKKGYGVYKNAGVDLKKDAQEGALATGRRTSQGLKGNQYKSKSESKGNTYYEYRANRLDVKQPKGKQKYPKLAYGGYMAKGGKVVELKEEDYVWNAVGKKLIVSKVDDKNYYFDGFDSSKSAFPKELVNNYIKKGAWTLKNPKMAYGGETQGYDDREDERLGMKYGKMASKDLNSTRARRDDARFEERGKMADGGMIELQSVGAIYNPQTNMIYAMYSKDEGYKHKGKEYDVESGQDVDEIDDEYFLNALSQEDKAILFGNKMADGGMMAKGGKLVGKQKNLDVNENGKLDAEDFKMLRGEKMEHGGDVKYTKKWRVVGITIQGKKFEKEITLGRMSNKDDVKYALKRMPDTNIREVTLIEEMKEGGYMAEGGKMAEGGITEKEVVDSNAQMVLSQIKAVKHHADELSKLVSMKSDIEAWVVGKIERASTDLSDITHYLDGQHEKMSMGGSVYHYTHKMDKK
jgi:hypothetical protein